MIKTKTIAAALLLVLAGCCGPKVEEYAGKQPTLDIRQYFNGNLEAWGAFVSRGGTSDPRFYVRLQGNWQGNEGTLAEQFFYSDGHRQQREWHLHMTDAHHFIATAADVTSPAIGAQYGNSFHMRYTLQVVSKDGKKHDVDMDDWLYLIDDTHMVNRAQMNKFGFNVGELIIGFRKIGDDE